MAIVLDGELYSAPNIKGAIETGNGEITGHLHANRKRLNWRTSCKIRCARR